MTVIDTSVLVAMIKDEADHDAWIAMLRGKADLMLPTSCYVEAAMVLAQRPGGRADIEKWLSTYAVTLLGSDARQARLAADAFERFGRGSGHAAKLNFGDCLAYAAAAAHGAPLLFKGEDFAATDVRRAD